MPNFKSTFIKMNGSSAGYPSGVPRTRIWKLFLILKSASYRSEQFKLFHVIFHVVLQILLAKHDNISFTSLLLPIDDLI